jgi:transposase
LNHPPRGADVYVEDEAELSLFPTLKRCWMLRGQQRQVRAPGERPPKRQEYGATDWRTGEIVRVRAEKRDAQAFCRLAEKCLRRSAKRKRRVIIVTDGARIHKPEKSKRVAELLQHYGRRLRLRYIPKYSPECMPMEKLWNDWRDNVTHNHDRDVLGQLLADSDRYFRRRKRDPQSVLRTIGSPFARRYQNRKT